MSETMTEQHEWLTVPEVARKYRVSPYTIREWAKQGDLAGAEKQGRDWKFLRSELAYIGRRRAPAQSTPAAAAAAERDAAKSRYAAEDAEINRLIALRKQGR